MLLPSEKQQSIKLVGLGLGVGLLIPLVCIFSSIIFSLNSYLVIAPKFDEAGYFQEGLAKVKVGNKYGYIDKTGKTVIPTQFDSIEIYKFNEGLALAKVKIGKPGDKYSSSNKYDYIGEIGDKYSSNNKYGYVEETGKIAIPLQFDDAGHFQKGFAKVRLGDNYGYVDKTGKTKIVISRKSEKSDSFEEELTPVKVGYEYGYVDKTGKTVISPQFSEASKFYEGLAKVKVGYKYGYVDKTGKIVIPPQFDESSTYESLGCKADYYCSQIDENGDFYEGLARVNIGGKWGYIDRKGKIIIPLQFNHVSNFHEGLASVEIGGTWGYIDKTGKIVIAPQFDQAGDFYKGLASVGTGYIDKTGKMVFTLEFEKDESEVKSKEAESLQEGLEPVKMGHKYGYIRTPLK